MLWRDQSGIVRVDDDQIVHIDRHNRVVVTRVNDRALGIDADM